jgi:hypothetical protein
VKQNITWVTRWYHSLNEYVVRTGHQENINRNDSEPDNDYGACDYSEVQVIINKRTNFRCLSGYSKRKKVSMEGSMSCTGPNWVT